jgi:hypothetical protein
VVVAVGLQEEGVVEDGRELERPEANHETGSGREKTIPKAGNLALKGTRSEI